jgi:diaminopimelate epimerase
VILDCTSKSLEVADFPSLSKKLCDRVTGIGADTLLLIEPSETADFAMRVWGPEGTPSEMCGNGLRCILAHARKMGFVSTESVRVETGGGILIATFVGEDVSINMGQALLKQSEIGMLHPLEESFINQDIGEGFFGSAVSMGNPHLVIFMPDIEQIDFENLGPKFARHKLFPNQTNVHFAQVINETHLKMRPWERGAGATLACGTGACAVTVAGVLNGLCQRKVTVSLPGGNLEIEYRSDETVQMTGSATHVFSGTTNL